MVRAGWHAGVAAGVWLIAASAPAQSPAKKIAETVQVSVVNVEVYVTDGDGRPVHGLRRDDFTLLVDGKPVELSNFFAASPIVAEPEPIETRPALAPAPELPPEQALNIVILVDDLNLSNSSRNQVLGKLESFLDDWVRPQDRVLIATFNRTLKIRHPFAAAPRDAARVIGEMRRETSEGVFHAAQVRDILGELNLPLARIGTIRETEAERAERLMQMVEAYASERYALGQAEFGALTRLADQLAGLPGRKAMVFVSDGVTRLVGMELFAAWEQVFPQIAAQGNPGTGRGPMSPAGAAARFDLGPLLTIVERHANAAGVTFYTVNAVANRGLEGISAETLGADVLPGFWQMEAMNRGQTMFNLAQATGGRSFFNTPTLGDAFATMAQDLESYYSLGFVPARIGSGSYHRFEVRVGRPGVKVRFREGYLDVSPDQRLDAKARASLFVAGPDNPLGVAVETGQPKEGSGKTFLVPFVVRLPGARVVLVPDGETARARLTFAFATEDDKGRQSELQRKTIEVPVPTRDLETVARQSLAFDFTLQLRAGTQRIAVTVRDEVGAVDGSVVLPITITGTGFVR